MARTFFLELRGEMICRIYRRLGYTLSFDGHDACHFRPQVPESLTPPLPSMELLHEYTCAPSPAVALPVDPHVGPGQARAADRKAIQRGDTTLEEVAPKRARYVEGRQVRPRQRELGEVSGTSEKKRCKAGAREERSLAQESHLADTIAEVTPSGSLARPQCPALDSSLVGNCIAFKWNIGWEQGKVRCQLSAEHRQKKKTSKIIPTANYEVFFVDATGPNECTLNQNTYSCDSSASIGSWCAFESDEI